MQLTTPGEPTPWATGLTVTVLVAILMAAIDLLLSYSLRASYGWLWIPANLVVGLGLTPTVLLLRRAPFWRWVVHGVAAGQLAAWLVLLLAALA